MAQISLKLSRYVGLYGLPTFENYFTFFVCTARECFEIIPNCSFVRFSFVIEIIANLHCTVNLRFEMICLVGLYGLFAKIFFLGPRAGWA